MASANNPKEDQPQFPVTPTAPPAEQSPPQAYNPILAQVEVPNNDSRSSGIGPVVIVCLFIIFFILASAGAAVAVAYEKIKINNPKLQQVLSQYVIGLPFMPKTPKFLLSAAALAHQKILRESFDISLALESDGLSSSLGMNKLDISLRGDLDYTDQKNLQANLDASITKDFNLSLRKKDNFVYLKIINIPPMITSLMASDSQKLKSLFDNWIAFDTSLLTADARKYLDTNNQNDLFEVKTLATLQNEMADKITLSSDYAGDYPAYKLTVLITPEMLDKISAEIYKNIPVEQKALIPKASETIKDLKIEMWIDKSQYFIRKLIASSKFNYAGTAAVPGLSKPADVSMAMVVKLDNFGKAVEVKVPEKSIKAEEFYQRLMQVTAKPSLPPTTGSPKTTPHTPIL